MTATFGALLRRMREAAGLSQEELAERAGLSSHAISALERGIRTRPYPHTVRALTVALGVGEDDREALAAAVPPRRTPSTPGGGAPAAGAGRVPSPTTALLGREQELDRITALLREHRLVTLTGTGGVGKTRLAVEAARQMQQWVEHGVSWVDLAPVTDVARVLPEVARAVTVDAAGDPLTALREHMGERTVLVVLDNVEHLLDAVPDLADALAQVPGLTLLATSRAPMRLRGEVEVAVGPLPPAEAARLLLDRAGESSHGWGEEVEDAEPVAALCRALAGIPLALELAAARSRLLGPAELLDRLDPVLLAGGGRDLPERQRTMRATLDWSHGLLSDDEQLLLRVLSTFVGGARLDDLEQVTVAAGHGELDVLSALESLVEHSLVVRDARGRFRMLEPIAQYAAGRLVEAGEQERTALAHARHFLALAEHHAPDLLGERQLVALERVDQDQANFTGAVELLTRAGHHGEAGRLCWSLWLYWWLRGHAALGRRLAEPTLTDRMPVEVRPLAELAAATACFALGDVVAAEGHWQHAVASADDPVTRANSVAGLALVALAGSEMSVAAERFEEALECAVAGGEAGDWIFALCHIWLGTIALVEGDHELALQRTDIGLASAQARGDRLTAYIALYNLSQVELRRGHHDRARDHLERSLHLSAETGDHGNVSYLLEVLAVVEAATDRHARVPLLLGAAQNLREGLATQYGYYRPDPGAVGGATDAARQVLGPDRFEDALDVGRRSTPDEAIALGLVRP